DGAEAPLLRVNGMWLGVTVDGGSHEVRFRYRVPGLRAGLALSALALLVLLGSALLRRRLPTA
ncbi:MAG: hypothetical protein ACK4N5_15070, partial [Myxococcales bacterium]